MKIKEIRIKSNNELQRMLKEERAHLHELGFDLASKKLKKVRAVRESKKNIARILTILNEKARADTNTVNEKETVV